MKLIDTINRCEWSPNFADDVPHSGVIRVENGHPFFMGFNKDLYFIKWPECELVGFTEQEINARNAANVQAAINQEALQYLASTDWYIIRQQETGVSVPENILQERQAARGRILNAN